MPIMANDRTPVVMLVVVGFCCVLALQLTTGAHHAAPPAPPCSFPAIFVFGDSLSDTGNGNLTGSFTLSRTGQRPYGETFPGSPSGRFSDGRVLVDFLAIYLGLPLLNPSQDTTADFRGGVNYAVGGATALDAGFLQSNGIFARSQEVSLDVQIGRHLAFKASGAGDNKPNRMAYANGLYVLEIASNDYLDALQVFYPSSVINSGILPRVIDKIYNATEVLYANGARHFLLFSVPPIGCAPSQLAASPQAIKDGYGCLRDVNSLSYNHGVRLLSMVEHLRTSHPDASYVFVDYYGAFDQVLHNSAAYGISNTLDACCGAGSLFPYRYNLLLFCNRLASTVVTTLCPKPSAYISWDGIHFTDSFNSIIFNLTIASGAYLNPSHGLRKCSSTYARAPQT